MRQLSHNYSPPLTVRETEKVYVIYIAFSFPRKISVFIVFFPMREILDVFRKFLFKGNYEVLRLFPYKGKGK